MSAEGNNPDWMAIIIDRQSVEQSNVGETLQALQRLVGSPALARHYFQLLDIGFDGYDHDRREIFEIPEIRDYLSQLDQQFPYWLRIPTERGQGFLRKVDRIPANVDRP